MSLQHDNYHHDFSFYSGVCILAFRKCQKEDRKDKNTIVIDRAEGLESRELGVLRPAVLVSWSRSESPRVLAGWNLGLSVFPQILRVIMVGTQVWCRPFIWFLPCYCRTGTDHHSFTWELDRNVASCAQNPEVGSQDPQSGDSSAQ